MRHVNQPLWAFAKPPFTFVTCSRVRDKGTAEALGSSAPSMRRKRRLLRQRLSSGQTLGRHTHKGGRGRCSHVFGVVRTDAHAHTQAQAASAGPQTPGYVARRDEVSLRESALGSHTRPGGADLKYKARTSLAWDFPWFWPSRVGREGPIVGKSNAPSLALLWAPMSTFSILSPSQFSPSIYLQYLFCFPF